MSPRTAYLINGFVALVLFCVLSVFSYASAQTGGGIEAPDTGFSSSSSAASSAASSGSSTSPDGIVPGTGSTGSSVADNWLAKITGFFVDLVKSVLKFVFDLLLDVVVWVFGLALELLALIVNSIPIPSFLQQYSLGSMMAGLDPGILYFVALLKIPEALAIVGAGVGFRLLRKVLTLAQW